MARSKRTTPGGLPNNSTDLTALVDDAVDPSPATVGETHNESCTVPAQVGMFERPR